MIVLNGTLCSPNFRRTGFVQACINLSTQIICLIMLCKVVIEAEPHKKGYYVHGHRIGKNQQSSITNILIDVMFFVVVDIIAYIWLIFGLLKNKQTIITGWLIFSIMELIVTLISSSYFAVYITANSQSGASVFVLIIPILISMYMIYNICVVYTIRHHMVEEKNSPIQSTSNTLFANASDVSYPGYRIPHSPYVPNIRPQSASCSSRSISIPQRDNLTRIPPPSYREANFR